MRVDPSTLLCESCGYPIGELPREGHCPECGRAIAESLPERRVGSPWQQGRGVGAWLRTVLLIARRPRSAWSIVRVERKASADLLSATCFIAAVLCAIEAALAPQYPRGFVRFLGQGGSGRLAIAAVVVISFTAVLLVLSRIEYTGIRFFGRRRRWRVTHEVGMAVIGHASVGWLLAPITLPVCWWIASAGLLGALNGAQGPGPIASAVTVAAMLAGPLIPLLAFEGLVYLGVRRMRFANVGE